MKSQFAVLAIVLAGLPALAWGQGSCGCSSRVSMRGNPGSYGTWADYQPAGHMDGCGCNACAPSCCDPCCRPLLCIIPNTVRKIGCALDCLLPCGPRVGAGCGVSCGSGVSCSGGCPSCSSPAGMGHYQIEEPLPLPPQPKVQDARHQPTKRTSREYATAPLSSNRTASTRPATKSVLTRVSEPTEAEVSRANHMHSTAKKPVSVVKRTSAEVSDSSPSPTPEPRRLTDIPHNPLR